MVSSDIIEIKFINKDVSNKMSDLMKLLCSIFNSTEYQTILNILTTGGTLRDIYRFFKEKGSTLAYEAFSCFDAALETYCLQNNIEYDVCAISRLFSDDGSIAEKLNSPEFEENILKTALNADIVTDTMKKKWTEIVDETIATGQYEHLEKYRTQNANRLISELYQRTSEPKEEMPLIFTEKAFRPPMEDSLDLREQDRQDILDYISAGERLILVYGIGGVGKSTVCSELFYELERNQNRHLAWITYNGSSLEDDFITQFYFPPREDVRKKRIRYFLENEIAEDTVIFVDNLNIKETEDPFIQVLNRAKCNVICTSRITRYNYFKSKYIDFLSPEKCVRLYKKYAELDLTDSENDSVIYEIVQKVGRHTLVIEILGKIAACEKYPPKKILDELKEKGIDMQELTDVGLNEDTLAGHLCRIFPVEKLNQEQKYILAHFAFCPLEDIPLEIENWIGLKSRRSVRTLIKYGWFSERDNTYYMHPIVKEVVKRTCFLKEEDFLVLASSLAERTKYNRNTGVSATLPYYPYMKLVLDKIKNRITPSAAWICFNLGCIDRLRNDLNQGLLFFNKALEYWKNPLMEQYENTEYINTRIINIYVQIGWCHCQLGDLASARKWYSMVTNFNGPVCDPELLAQMGNNMGLVEQEEYRRLKNSTAPQRLVEEKFSEASKLFEKTIYEFRKMNKKDEYMALAYSNAGVLYMEHGDYEKASEYFLNALEIREPLLDQFSPDRESMYYYLGKLHIKMAEEINSDSEKSAYYYKTGCDYLKKCRKICIQNSKIEINKITLEQVENLLVKYDPLS